MIHPHEAAIIDTIIRKALSEDLNTNGDITSQALFSKDDTANAVIKSKESGILSGVYLIEPIFKAIDSDLSITTMAREGDRLEKDTEICRVYGSLQSILASERTVLNFLQRLCGIATHTNRLVSLIQDTGVKLLDTRKTTPSLRILEKKAVLAGGGTNHRFGLFDMILIKDTHVKASGGSAAAVRKAKQFCQTYHDIKIEVEVQSLEEFYDACAEHPDRIMLDNMSIDDIVLCVLKIKNFDKSIELEVSGNITAENIRAIAETGVDYISSGAITHSATALDIHLILL